MQSNLTVRHICSSLTTHIFSVGGLFLLTHLEYISVDEHSFVELYLDNGN